MDNFHAARQLFLQESFGVLSTISVDLPGYPFGSVTPYCADEQGRPVLYISHIAQHTRNILADSRVSLTVFETTQGLTDVQAQGRVTLIGDAHPIDDDAKQIRERYFRYFPNSRQYQNTHDFAFFALDLVRVRFIGGFGKIYWVEPNQFMISNPFSAAQETRIIDHMNNDHAPALKHYAGDREATMIGIDAEGFDVLIESGKLRVSFEKPVLNMEQARQALVEMARRP